MKYLSIVLGCLLMLTGITAMAAASANEMDKVVYTSPAKAISVTQKKPEFTITLKSNPTTGFSWFLGKYDEGLIKAVSQKYVAPSSKLMGAPGYEVWTFKVLPKAFAIPSTMEIEMDYARPWEKKPGNKTVFRVYTSK